MTIDLDALEALANAATPGEWRAEVGPSNTLIGYASFWHAVNINGRDLLVTHTNHPIGDVEVRKLGNGYVRYSLVNQIDVPEPAPHPDVAFIAAARTAIPELIERVRELGARIDAAHAAGFRYCARLMVPRAEVAEAEVERLRVVADQRFGLWERARDALDQYGEHENGCPQEPVNEHGQLNARDMPCTCGLDAILRVPP